MTSADKANVAIAGMFIGFVALTAVLIAAVTLWG